MLCIIAELQVVLGRFLVGTCRNSMPLKSSPDAKMIREGAIQLWVTAGKFYSSGLDDPTCSLGDVAR